jgi:hypothetical protein
MGKCRNMNNLNWAVHYVKYRGVTVTDKKSALDLAGALDRVEKLEEDGTCDKINTDECNNCREFYENIANAAYRTKSCGRLDYSRD